MQLALYQPDIPQNLGSVLRLCACMDVICHIIEPCGFIMDDKRLKRVAMDYAERVNYVRHISWNAFLTYVRQQNVRIVLMTTKASDSLYDFTFRPDDILLMGRESAGVPQEVADAADARLRIPMSASARSLNIAQAAAMAVGEMGRQGIREPEDSRTR